MFGEIWDTVLGSIDRITDGWPDADFIGDFPEGDMLNTALLSVMNEVDQIPPKAIQERVITLLSKMLRKATPFESSTGVVVAGYGEKELFPTLEHFELYSPVFGTLKYRKVEAVDISRNGPRAKVMAFAQREMAERFLFGLDIQIKDKILRFCRRAISSIGDVAASLVKFEEENQATSFRATVATAEATFVSELETLGMETIRQESQTAVEDMVEFMPKQDLAEFAEALVNLSSLQRRVNSGFETVGGPIDVAVISKSEGFVWVKRKHYFPKDLNARFFNRVGGQP